MQVLGNVSQEKLDPTVQELQKRGYQPLSSGLPQGNYSGVVDAVTEFISVATYDKPNGTQKGGIMFAVLATISFNGGESFKVYGFDAVGAKKLLMNKQQISALSAGCSFSFEVSDKGYSTKVKVETASSETASSEISEATIKAMSKPKLTALATENGIDVSGLDINQLRSKLVAELV